MTATKIRTTCLLVAGVLSSCMATYHFWLPSIWDWGPSLKELPPSMNWGVSFINICFSFLLLWGGVLTVITGLKRQKPDTLSNLVIAGLGLFWGGNAAYQLLHPMPVPASLTFLRWFLFGFAAFVALLFIISLLIQSEVPGRTNAKPK